MNGGARDLVLRAVGEWRREQVAVEQTSRSTRRVVPEVERVIEQAWASASARPGVNLFDGPMCRMDSFEVSGGRLKLVVSPTSYRAFLGTNLQNAHLAATYGPDVMANPVGVSTLPETADGFLLLGVRNASVAYYPDRVHPFAGTLEPEADGADPFAAARRELAEELALRPAEVADLRCVGLVEDAALLQPELIFLATTTLTCDVIERRLDAAEHNAILRVEARREAVEAVLRDARLTPVARASLMLWGRLRVGGEWFTGVAG